VTAASRRRRRPPALAACALLLAAGATACGSTGPTPDATVTAYLHAWGALDDAGMRAVTDTPPAGFTATNALVVHAVHATAASYAAGPVARAGDRAMVPVTGTLTVPGTAPVTTHSTLLLHLASGHWKVEWSPGTVATGLGAGDHLSVVTAWPARAPVLGAGGIDLTPSTQTVSVGVTGSRLKDPAAVSAALVGAGLPAPAVQAAIAAAQAQPGTTHPVGSLPQDQYARVAGRIYPLPGTTFATTDQHATITPDLGAHTVGSVLPITAEQLKALGAPYTATSLVGRGGLEAADERRLAGKPSLTAVAVAPSGAVGATVASAPPVPGQPVQTTIDPTVQRAAEAAMNGTSQAAAMVVLQPSTGNVLASVSRPTASGDDLAFQGAAPPGSTFKVITATALLEGGLPATATLTCPPTITVGGRTFHNDEGESTPTLSFAQAFAVSCNTAFIGAATQHLSASQLVTAAGQLGLGASFAAVGLPATSGSVPAPTSPDTMGAAAIGQGQTTASPLGMATVAATAATGVLRLPRLVVPASPAPATPSPSPTTAPAPSSTSSSSSPGASTAAPAAGAPLPGAVVAALHTFMAGVTVAGGTAGGAGLPAGTYGKTGTAEYGTGPTLPTHAWFVGFRGDLAFAVYVDNGVGGSAAAPLAAALLNALPGQG
jgi:cell division protein FtsI/penicillin-binding protein 2